MLKYGTPPTEIVNLKHVSCIEHHWDLKLHATVPIHSKFFKL